MPDPHDVPAQICADNGHVIVDRPGAVAVTLTLAAADETAHRLIESAAQAQGQQLTKQAAGR